MRVASQIFFPAGAALAIDGGVRYGRAQPRALLSPLPAPAATTAFLLTGTMHALGITQLPHALTSVSACTTLMSDIESKAPLELLPPLQQ